MVVRSEDRALGGCSVETLLLEAFWPPVRLSFELRLSSGRAAPVIGGEGAVVLGGLGAVKSGANYAASLLAAEEAKARGYSQVLWTDASNHRYFEEVGTMNLVVRIGDEFITPPLGGSILSGVTRDLPPVESDAEPDVSDDARQRVARLVDGVERRLPRMRHHHGEAAVLQGVFQNGRDKRFVFDEQNDD